MNKWRNYKETRFILQYHLAHSNDDSQKIRGIYCEDAFNLGLFTVGINAALWATHRWYTRWNILKWEERSTNSTYGIATAVNDH